MSLATVDSSVTLTRRERSANDWYVEPTWAVHGLLDVQMFKGGVWDPACGRGTIPETLARLGHKTHGSDIVDRGYGDRIDFLSAHALRSDNIVSNPPFNLAEDFLRAALVAARRKVAFLLRLSWCEGKRRRWVWDVAPLAAVHPFASRVSMPPGDHTGKASGGAVAFAWFVWDHNHSGSPIVRRIERGPA